MMERLFSYGTLQLEQVQLETFGRKLLGNQDSIIGYVISEVEIKDPEVIKTSGKKFHPILRYTGNVKDRVAGTIFEITPHELSQADDYEVEQYVRVEAQFLSGNKAWAYVCAETEQTHTTETTNE